MVVLVVGVLSLEDDAEDALGVRSFEVEIDDDDDEMLEGNLV